MTWQDRKWALVLTLACWLDLLCSGVISWVALKYAFRDNAVSLCCLGVQAACHWASSLVLAVRFIGDLVPERSPFDAAECTASRVPEAFLLRIRRRRDLKRERTFAAILGGFMLVASLTLFFKAVQKLKLWDAWYLDHREQDREVEQVTSLLAWWSAPAYLLQAGIRLVAAMRLRRRIVWYGTCGSILNLLYLLVLAVAAYEEREWSWKADPISAVVLVTLALSEGGLVLALHRQDVDTTLHYDARA